MPATQNGAPQMFGGLNLAEPVAWADISILTPHTLQLDPDLSPLRNIQMGETFPIS